MLFDWWTMSKVRRACRRYVSQGPGIVIAVNYLRRRYAWLIDKLYLPSDLWIPTDVIVDGRRMIQLDEKRIGPVLIPAEPGHHAVSFVFGPTRKEECRVEVDVPVNGVAGIALMPSRLSLESPPWTETYARTFVRSRARPTQ